MSNSTDQDIEYFATECPDKWGAHLVFLRNGQFYRVNPDNGRVDEGRPMTGSSIQEELARDADGRSFLCVKYALRPGQRHPRIARNRSMALSNSEVRALEAASVSMEILLSELQEVFRVVEPVPANNEVYGHRLRQILILACTEVEAGLQAVLTANSVAARGKFYQMSDFARLDKPMRLLRRKVVLTRNRLDQQPIQPFADWDQAKPTQSLPWYAAYNKVKHDREANLPEATMERAVSAVAAAMVVNIAQFGESQAQAGGPLHQRVFAAWNERLFEPHEMYFPGSEPWNWAMVPWKDAMGD